MLPKHERGAASHDIAERLRLARRRHRRALRRAARRRRGAAGPPVLQTLVAEIYGPDGESRAALAAEVRRIFRETPGVVDVDWYAEADQLLTRFVIDK
ncbi:MAG: hypothetical protein R3F11_26480 [Verrucomicrobiales bacterium]